MLADPMFYVFAVPAVILVGLSKGGFAGVGALAMPLMALAISPVKAAAILLPILILQDGVSVWAFRRAWDRGVLLLMLPTSVVGVMIGYGLAAKVSADAVLGAVGGVSILFALQRLWASRGGRTEAPADAPAWIGGLLGVVSGFTSQIAHAGAPPFQMWVLPKRLPPASLVGTTALYFAALNWIKVPAYVSLGQFTRENLLAALALAPVAVLSTLAGVRLVRRIDPERFYTALYVLMVLVGAKLVWDAVSA